MQEGHFEWSGQEVGMGVTNLGAVKKVWPKSQLQFYVLEKWFPLQGERGHSS